jgi:uncharacterized RDD family membrane protein YckC
MLDTLRAIETPEGVTLDLRIAGPVVRFFAWTIDFMIRGAVYMVLAMTLPNLMGRFGLGILLIAIFMLEWFYPVLFEVFNRGATPGKRMMGITVLQDNGVPVGWSASVTRNLLRFADFLPVLYGFGVASMLINRDFKRLGDLAAGTIVVYRPVPYKVGELSAEPPVPPRYPLTLEQQRAVIAFSERAATLTPERAIELANIVAPLTQATDAPGMTRLFAIANWLVGKR